MFVQKNIGEQQTLGKGSKRRDRLSLASIMVRELKSMGYGQDAAARNLQSLGLFVSRRELVSVFSA